MFCPYHSSITRSDNTSNLNPVSAAQFFAPNAATSFLFSCFFIIQTSSPFSVSAFIISPLPPTCKMISWNGFSCLELRIFFIIIFIFRSDLICLALYLSNASSNNSRDKLSLYFHCEVSRYWDEYKSSVYIFLLQELSAIMIIGLYRPLHLSFSTFFISHPVRFQHSQVLLLFSKKYLRHAGLGTQIKMRPL